MQIYNSQDDRSIPPDEASSGYVEPGDELICELKKMACKIAGDIRNIREQFHDKNILSSDDKVFERIMKIYERSGDILRAITEADLSHPSKTERSRKKPVHKIIVA